MTPALELIELNVDLIARTDRTVHVRDHGTGRLVWLPIALIEISQADDGESWVIDIPEWLCIERELM